MSVAQKVKGRIDGVAAGSIFSSIDFVDIATQNNVDVIFHRLASSGMIRKLGYGLYDKPRKSSILGDLIPDLDQVIKVYSKKLGQNFISDQVNAANMFGLSTQVPSKLTCLTNGKTHSITICGIDMGLD